MSEHDPIRILGVAGSLREASYARRLVRLAAAISAELGDGTEGAPLVEFVEFDGIRAIEHFDEDLEGTQLDGVAAWRAAIAQADAVFVATPEYNASIPGALKNAFDWASRAEHAPHDDLRASAMYGKPAAVIGSSTGQFGGAWARDELAKSLRTQGARVVAEPSVAVPNAATAFDDDGELRSSAARAQLAALLQALAATAQQLRAARAVRASA